jgi:hypothetical protein
MPKKRIADMNRSERIRYKQLEGQRERRYRRSLITEEERLAILARRGQATGTNVITLAPVPSLQTPTDTGYLDYREGLKLQRLIERMET